MEGTMTKARIVALSSALAIFSATTSALGAPCTSDAECDEGYACVGFGGEPTCQSFPKSEAKVEAPKAAAPPPVYESYGGQTAILDVAAVGITVAGLASQSGLLAVGGVLTYWLGAPIVHFAHANLIGFASLGLRMFAPPVGAFVGLFFGAIAVRGQGSYGPAVVGGAVGLGGALIGVSLLDALVLAKQRVDSPAPPPKETTFAIAPYVMPEKRGASTGLSLTF
jgi:hypothetical protein